jgi:hypothetical protein
MPALLAATRGGIVQIEHTAPDAWTSRLTLPDVDVRALCPTAGDVYAATHGDGVYRSTDGGGSWAARGLERQRVTALAAGNGAVYAGTKEPRVHITRDGGETWAPLARFPRDRMFRSSSGAPWEPCGDELPRLAKLACGAPGELFMALGDGRCFAPRIVATPGRSCLFS